jgi:hypothetical protein
MSGTFASAGLRIIFSNFPEIVASTLPSVSSATLLLDLQADTLMLNDGDPVSLWEDQSGNNHDFTQTGSVRPLKQTVDLYPCVYVAVDQSDPELFTNTWMLGENITELNDPGFAVFVVAKYDGATSLAQNIITKYEDNTLFTGWNVEFGGDGLPAGAYMEENGSSNYIVRMLGINSRYVLCAEFLTLASGHSYINGDNSGEFGSNTGIVTSISTTEPLRLGGTQFQVEGVQSISAWINSIMIYKITDFDNWATDRAAITAWLANRYGITL